MGVATRCRCAVDAALLGVERWRLRAACRLLGSARRFLWRHQRRADSFHCDREGVIPVTFTLPDAVLALCILGHLPCPPSLNAESNRVEIVWRVDVGVNLVDPPGSCGSLGRRKLELVTMVVGGPMGVTGRPSQACGIDLRISRRK